MERKLPFRLPSRTTWRLAGSGAALALVSYFLALRSFSGGGGFGSFLLFAAVLYGLSFQFSEWRRITRLLLALALVGGAALFAPSLVPPVASALAVGVMGGLAYAVATPRADAARIAERLLVTALIFLAAFLFFGLLAQAGVPALFGNRTAATALPFFAFFVVLVLVVRDEVRAWGVLRVGEGKFISVAVGFVGAELAGVLGLLPLGPARAAALVTLTLLLVREGLAEAYHGGLRRKTVLQGLAVFFALSVVLFASVSWTL